MVTSFYQGNIIDFFKIEFKSFYKVFLNLSLYKRFLIILFFFLPGLMIIGRAAADLAVVLIVLSFILRSVIVFDWYWLKIHWVKFSIIFWIVGLISSSLSQFPEISLLNCLPWIRFPLLAVALVYWVFNKIDAKFILIFILFLYFFLLCIVSLYEILFLNYGPYLYLPFGNPMVGSFYTKVLAPVFLLFIYIYLRCEFLLKVISFLFILIFIYIFIESGNRAGCFGVFLSSITFLFLLKPNPRSILLPIFLSLIFITMMIYFNEGLRFRFFGFMLTDEDETNLITGLGTIQTYKSIFGNSFFYFKENFILGVGPTNIQNILWGEIVFYDYYPEHPHNHYLQVFAETGLVGGIVYVSIILSMFINFYRTNHVKSPFLDNFFSILPFSFLVLLFWPLANSFDLYGQQQNVFLWYGVSLCLIINSKDTISN